MPRMRYECTGTQIWTSHLDTVRSFQRAFARAGIAIRCSEGFNPHPYISVAMPLPVGVSSSCEILDFEPKESEFAMDDMMERLNQTLPAGLHVTACYPQGRKFREIAYMRTQISLHYDGSAADGKSNLLYEILNGPCLMAEKRHKNGTVSEVDILPMISHSEISQSDATILLTADLHCLEPSLSPNLLLQALYARDSGLQPVFAEIHRIEILDGAFQPFR